MLCTGIQETTKISTAFTKTVIISVRNNKGNNSRAPMPTTTTTSSGTIRQQQQWLEQCISRAGVGVAMTAVRSLARATHGHCRRAHVNRSRSARKKISESTELSAYVGIFAVIIQSMTKYKGSDLIFKEIYVAWMESLQ